MSKFHFFLRNSLFSLRAFIAKALKYRASQLFGAALERAGLALTIFFGATPLLIPLILGIIEKKGPKSESTSQAHQLLDIGLSASPAILALLVLAGVLSALITLRRSSPEEYARITSSGRPGSEQISILSSHIALACSDFLRFTKKTRLPLQKLADSNEDISAINAREEDLDLTSFQKQWEKAKRKLNYPAYGIERFVRRQQRDLQRIAAMKRITSQETQVPVRCLCDHIVQYGPFIHQDRATKFFHNLQELSDTLDREKSPAILPRLLGLVRQNLEIIQQAEKRRDIQRLVLGNKTLLSEVIRLASFHSVSGGLSIYAKILAEVAKRGGDDLPERFKFAHRKQRAYPGLALHETLVRLTERSSEVVSRLRGFNDLMWEKTVRFLKDLPDNRNDREPPIEAIAELPSALSGLLTECRRSILNEFRSTYLDWGKETQSIESSSAGQEPCLIVTHGYSRTVRECLKWGLATPKPDLFILADTREEYFDSRKLSYETREGLRESPVNRIIIGTTKNCIQMIETQERNVLLLIGAEAFERPNSSTGCRIAHPRGLRPLLNYLEEISFLRDRPKDEKNSSSKVQFRWNVVAEHYKARSGRAWRDEVMGIYRERVDLYDLSLLAVRHSGKIIEGREE